MTALKDTWNIEDPLRGWAVRQSDVTTEVFAQLLDVLAALSDNTAGKLQYWDSISISKKHDNNNKY